MACDQDPDRCEGPSPPEGEAALLAAGWQRCFIADGDRLEDAIQTYEEIGFEVTTLPIDARSSACAACSVALQAQRVIYTRKQSP